MLSKALRITTQVRAVQRAQRLMAQQMQMQTLFALNKRQFSEAQVQSTEAPEEEAGIAEINKRVGADETFLKEKHSYILKFPWNYEHVLENFNELPDNSYWNTFINNSRSVVCFNNLFRDFHQSCAIPDHAGIQRVCEPRLASYVSDAVKRIHFHGLDVEMANLTVEQPSIKVIKAEIHQNLNVDRDLNSSSIGDYTVHSNHNVGGMPWKTYQPVNDQRHCLDALEVHENRPYLVAITCMIESPMKLFVWNQNMTHILIGNDDSENIKNVVRFEANLRWFDFLNLLPTNNKQAVGEWKITDFNDVLNGNQYFKDQE